MANIVLTSQFTVPDAKSFSEYVSYATRKEALEEKKELSKVEKSELEKISDVIENIHSSPGYTYRKAAERSEQTATENEAVDILESLKGTEGFEKYIDYMSRYSALKAEKNTGNLKADEVQEMNYLEKRLGAYPALVKVEEDNTETYIPGVFSCEKRKMTEEHLQETKAIITQAQAKGSVFWQDVISFESGFLEREKIYNPVSGNLDEKRLQDASIKMMETMFSKEKIDDGYWFASIHRNTEHVHIHFGIVERENTRPLMTFKKLGEELVQPRGMRKASTIRDMKSEFSNTLVDRTAQLSRLNYLRDSLPKYLRESYEMSGSIKGQAEMLSQIYQELPENKKLWNYKNISEPVRAKVDMLTEMIAKENPEYAEFMDQARSLGDHYKELYGDTKTDFTANRMELLKSRLGNALLGEMRKEVSGTERVRKQYGAVMNNSTYKQEKSDTRRRVSRGEVKRVGRAVNNEFAMYKAQREHEMVERKVEAERNKQK